MCFKKYWIVIRKVKTKFASEIQEFEEFKKFMKEKLLDVIAYAILWAKNFQ